MGIHYKSSPEQKIGLFRSLFRGRDDVYPRRFENRRSGKTGYSPVCANEWVRDICEKPRIKCGACPHQRFLPVTDDVIHKHLRGRDEYGRDFVAGVYPMLLDETCFFLAIDLDKTNWQHDATAVLETCRRLNVPASLERSRSGNGGHIWIFFETGVPASIARRLGSYVLTETMEHRPDIGLDSYDRFFPNQDTLPKGGFGNLIALPLQKQPREAGNSVFLDDSMEPDSDQWAFLSSIERMTSATAHQIVSKAAHGGRIINVRVAHGMDDDDRPWTLPPSRLRDESRIVANLPACLDVTLSDQVYIPKENLPPPLLNQLVRLAAFQNPEFYKAQAMRLPTWGKPRIISCAEDHPKHFRSPTRLLRGCPKFAE